MGFLKRVSENIHGLSFKQMASLYHLPRRPETERSNTDREEGKCLPEDWLKSN